MFRIYAGLAAASAATLLYEVVLTRLFSIAHGYHFAFLAIGLALLGLGASGTALALRPGWSERLSGAVLGLLSLAGAAALLGGYLAADAVPFDPYRVAWQPVQLLWLAAYLLALAAPFFLLGLVQGLPLAAWPERAGRLYAANLAGSGLGCLLALLALSLTSGPGAVVAAALAAACASLAFAGAGRRGAAAGRLGQVAAAAAVAALALLLWRAPSWLDLRLSPYKALSQILRYPDARVLHRSSSPLARLDVVESSSIRSAPGLSLAYQGPLPRQTGIVVDADSVLALTSRERLTREFLDALPIALPHRLRPRARVLVLEPGGGLSVLEALESGARSVVAVERNPQLADLVRSRFPSLAGGVYRDPRVRVVVAGPRRYAARTRERFDVVELALSESFRPVTAGAFSLSESYALTVEALRDYLELLAPGGLLVVHRWLQLPPVEEVRAAALVASALRRLGVEDPGRSILAVRSFSTMLIVARREPLTQGDIAAAKAFARERQLDLVHYPGIRRAEANRFNVLEEDLYYESFRSLLADPERLYRGYEYDVRPPTDDRPFFFHFFKWEQTGTVLRLLGKTWQPFGGGGYLIVLALLLLSAVLSLALLVVPLAVTLRRDRRSAARPGGRIWPLAYFAGIGLGFLLAEVALVQRLILLLDHPAYAFGVGLFGLLAFAGLGSLLSPRLPWRGALACLAAALALYPALLSWSVPASLAQSLPVRVAVALALVAPLGFLLGIPFPRGLRLLGETRPGWIPLAWGANGFASVISATLAAVLALSWGFAVVFWGAALAYLLALASVARRAGANAVSASRAGAARR